MKNPEWKWVWTCLVLAVVFFALIFIAGDSMDGMSGGYAVMFVSFFLFISSLGVAGLFFTRARAMDEILAGRDLLAHWIYPEDETKKSAEREYASYRETNRGLLFVVGVFLVLAMILSAIFWGEDGVLTAGILFLVLIIIAIVSVVAPKLEYRRALGASREAYITDKGLIYEGAVYPFKSFLMRMTDVRFENATGKTPPLLIFSFVQLVGLYILRPFDLSVPVPTGQEDKARAIAEKLGGLAEQEDNPVEPDKVCSQCGAYVKSGNPYCEACGAATGGTREPQESSITCPGCGARIHADAKFCGSCGYKLK